RPALLAQSLEVGVRILNHETAETFRVGQRYPEAHRRPEVLHVEHVPANAQGLDEAADVIGEQIEAIGDLVGAWSVAETRTEIVRGDDVVPAGQQRDELTIRVGGRRKAVEQQDDRAIW